MQVEQRSVAQFFFEIGYGACFAQAYILNGEKAPWPMSDAEVERAWEVAGEAHDDPEEFDRYLELAALSPVQDGPVREAAEQTVRDALMDSQYMAGVTAGWNAAQDDNPEAALASLRASRTGYMADYKKAKGVLVSKQGDGGRRVDRNEVVKWRDDALVAAAGIVRRYVDLANAEEAAGAIDDIIGLHSNPKEARAALSTLSNKGVG